MTAGRALFGSATGVLSSAAELYWDASNNRLGLLVAAPLVALHVNGDVILGAASVIGAAARTTIGAALGSATLKLQVAAAEDPATPTLLLVNSSGAEVFSITAAGRAHAAAGALASCAFTFTDDIDTGLYLPAVGSLGLVAAGAERVRLSATGVREFNVASAPSSNVADGGERYADGGASWWRSQNGLRTCLAGAGTADTTATQALRDSDEGTSANATEFLLHSVKLPETSILNFTFEVVAYQTGGAAGTVGDAFGATRQVRAGRKGAAAPRILGARTIGTDDDELGGATLRFDVSADSLELYATGLANKGISWSSSYQAAVLASPT